MSRHFRFVLHNSELVTEQSITFELPDIDYSITTRLRQQQTDPLILQLIGSLKAAIDHLKLKDNGYGYELHYLKPAHGNVYAAFNGITYLTKEQFENG